MLSMIPRASVAADRIVEVLDTESSVRPPDDAGHRGASSTARSSSATSRSPTPAPVIRCSTTSRSESAPARPPRSSAAPAPARRRSSTSSRACSTPPRAPCSSNGVDVRRARARTAVGQGRLRAADGRTCSPARSRPTCASDGRTPPRRSSGRRSRSPRRPASCRRCRRHRERDHPGRHERVGRPAPAAGDRPGARRAARHLRVRRRVLGARPRDRCSLAGGAGAAHRPRPRS